MSPASRPSAYDKAAELLAQRSHFRSELAAKLARRGYSEEEVAAALSRLAEHGYVDDERTARELAETLKARGPVGGQRVKAELLKRGASREVAQELAAVSPEDELALARQAAVAWERKGGGSPASLARHLDRKGFSRRSIFVLLDEHGQEVPEEL